MQQAYGHILSHFFHQIVVMCHRKQWAHFASLHLFYNYLLVMCIGVVYVDAIPVYCQKLKAKELDTY